MGELRHPLAQMMIDNSTPTFFIIICFVSELPFLFVYVVIIPLFRLVYKDRIVKYDVFFLLIVYRFVSSFLDS